MVISSFIWGLLLFFQESVSFTLIISKNLYQNPHILNYKKKKTKMNSNLTLLCVSVFIFILGKYSIFKMNHFLGL